VRIILRFLLSKDQGDPVGSSHGAHLLEGLVNLEELDPICDGVPLVWRERYLG
jgi:hypothetical protein